MPAQGGVIDEYSLQPYLLSLGETTEAMSNSSSEQRGRKKTKRTFNLGTFNVRGLTQEFKQEQLSHDMTRYGLDVLCIQETKIKDLTDWDQTKKNEKRKQKTV